MIISQKNNETNSDKLIKAMSYLSNAYFTDNFFCPSQFRINCDIELKL